MKHKLLISLVILMVLTPLLLGVDAAQGNTQSVYTASITSEVICDNLDTSCFSKYQSAGSWATWPWPTSEPPYGAYNNQANWTYNSHNTPLDWGRWRPNLQQDGEYDVYIWYPHLAFGSPDTTNAHYQIHHAGGDTYVTWNQSTNGVRWNKIATVQCSAGTNCYVKLTDESNETTNTHRVWFDAVKFVFRSSPPPEDTTDPSGNITSPATGITVGPGTVHLEANAWDNPGGSGVKRVEFWVRYDSTWHRVKDEYHPPYEADWQIPAGLVSQDIQIGIHVVDNAGNVAVDPGGKRTIHYVASASCTVPYFSQRDSRWINHPLRTNGVCSSYCNTIGKCGCTLTSSAMIFKYYDANLTPASLSDCMGTAACPFYWGTGAACSGGKAQWIGKSTFTWSRLERELNQNGRPVIVGMHKYVNGVRNTHWVVALSGSGSKTANYTIHDPWPIHGANMKLSAYSTWWLDWIAVYDGHPACGSLTTATTDEVPVRPQPVLAVTNPDLAAPQETLTIVEAQGLTASAVVTGSAWLYRMTDVTMTVQLIADSGAGNVTEMLVWTDSMTQTTWQSFSSFVYLPRSDEIYARFRDESENVSVTKADTLYPVASPVTTPSEVFLPLVAKQ